MLDYIDDGQPWRFDEESTMPLDDNDYTKIDVWKVARMEDRERNGFYSLGLKVPKWNDLHAMYEDRENHLGCFYTQHCDTFAQQDTVGLFCFLDRETAVDFAHKIARRQFVTSVKDPLYILRGKGILKPLIKPKKIANDQRDWLLKAYYEYFYFNKDSRRWRPRKWDPDCNMEKKRLTKKWLGITFMFAGFRTLDFEEVPEQFKIDPELEKAVSYPDPPEGFDPYDPQWDYLDAR